MPGKRRIAASLLTAGLLALGGVALSAGSASASTRSSCSASGQYATCVTAVNVNRPGSISVTVTASPNQTVYVAWSTTCAKGLGAGGESGDFTGITPITRTVKLSYASPDSCIVSTDAQLQDGGNSIHVANSSPAVAAPQVKGYDSKCVNDAGGSSANGTKIVLWPCNGGGAQDWTYTKDKLAHNGRCLTDPASGASGTRLILNGCSSAKNDLWVHKSNGEYILAAQAGKLCLNASSASDGTQLDVYACKNAATQHWSLP